MSSPDKYRVMALSAAKRAIEYLREHFLQTEFVRIVEVHESDVSRKVDLEVEDLIIRTLRDLGFDGAIVTEERGVIGEGPPFAVIDPLDGSLDYTLGIPYFIVSIGIAEGHTLEDVSAGALCPSFGHPCYSFSKTEGAFEGDREFRTMEPENTLIYYGEPVEEQISFLKKLYERMGRPKIRTPGAIAFDLLLTARGSVRAVADVRNKLRNVDVAAALPLLRMLGGYVNEDAMKTRVDDVKVVGDVLATRDEALFKDMTLYRKEFLGRA